KVVSDGTTLSLAGGSNNLMLVTDPGSVFTNFNDVHLGNASDGGNTIIVSNGATVFSDTVYYGGQSGSASNGIIVTGPGSALRVLAFPTNAPNGNSLSVGGFGNSDYLTISNGGLVTTRASVDVSGDRVILTVTGSGSVLSNSY